MFADGCERFRFCGTVPFLVPFLVRSILVSSCGVPVWPADWLVWCAVLVVCLLRTGVSLARTGVSWQFLARTGVSW